MPEKIESNLFQARFESDGERLGFLERTISKRIGDLRRKRHQEYIQTLKGFLEEMGVEYDGYVPRKYYEEIFKLRDGFDKTTNQIIVRGLDDLRKELEDTSGLKNFLPEMNAFIEAVRTMFLATEKLNYKEYQVMVGAPELSEEEIRRQEALREDMTEGRALVQWHVLQNESNSEYLKEFYLTLRRLLGSLGFKNEWWGMERGLRQELGVYKILKKKFKKISPGKPKEDAHYAIDFWVETEDGRTLIFQSKSSSLFGEQGIFDEQDIRKLERELSDAPYPAIKYRMGREGHEPPTSDLVKMKKLLQDTERAKKYAESLGIQNPTFYLLVSSANNFEEITGEPLSDKNKVLEKQLDSIAKQTPARSS